MMLFGGALLVIDDGHDCVLEITKADHVDTCHGADVFTLLHQCLET